MNQMMTSMVLWVLMAISLCMGQDIVVQRLMNEPVVDGKINEPAWNSLQWNDDFKVKGSEQSAKNQTRFKMGFTVKGIYCAIQCDDDSPGDIIAKYEDNQQIWEDDCVELFLCPNVETEYFHFIVNVAGARYNERRIKMSTIQNQSLLDWNAAAILSETGWQVEFFIPFSLIINKFDVSKTSFMFNVARHESDGTASSFYSVTSNFNEPDKFGKMGIVNLAESDIAEINTHVYEANFRKFCGAASKELASYLNSEDPLYELFVYRYCFKFLDLLIKAEEGIIAEEPMLRQEMAIMKKEIMEYDRLMGLKLVHDLIMNYKDFGGVQHESD